MITLKLAKGDVRRRDNETIRDDGTGHDMMKCGRSRQCVGIINNMSAEGRLIVEEERKGSRMRRTKHTKIWKKGDIISEKIVIVTNTLNQVIMENAEREGLNKERCGARRAGWYFGVVPEPQALHHFGVMMQQLR